MLTSKEKIQGEEKRGRIRIEGHVTAARLLFTEQDSIIILNPVPPEPGA